MKDMGRQGSQREAHREIRRYEETQGAGQREDTRKHRET